MGASNVMSLSEVRDKRTSQIMSLPQLYAELSRLGVIVAALSKVRRLGSWWVSGNVFTYYWSGRPQMHLAGVAVAVGDRGHNCHIMKLGRSDALLRRVSHT